MKYDVTFTEQGYEMISGNRRLHASKKAGLEYCWPEY